MKWFQIMVRSEFKLLGFGVMLLLAVVGCSQTTTTVEEIEEPVTESELTEAADKGSDSKEAKTGRQAPSVNADAVAEDNTAADDPNAQCTAKASRDDCESCCAIVGDGAGCAAQCESKPAADDCRTNGCSDAAEECTKCHTQWTCMPNGAKC